MLNIFIKFGFCNKSLKTQCNDARVSVRIKTMKQTITIGHFCVIDHLVLGVAAKNDESNLSKIELKTRMFYNWAKLVNSLESGEVDGAFLLFPLAMESFRKGVDIKLVLLGQREGQVLVMKKGLESISDLKGKTIFVPNEFSVHNILIRKILKKAGVDPNKDVTFKKSFDDIRELVTVIIEGKADAILTGEPWGTLAVKAGAGKIFSVSHETQMHHPCCVLVLRGELIRNNPSACEELIRSLVKAGMFMNAYPRQAAEIGEDFLGYPKNILLESLTHNRGHLLMWDLLPRLEDFSELEDFAVREMHLWKEPIDLEKFIEPKFAQEAYREWTIDTRKEVKDKGRDRTLPGSFGESFQKIKDRLENEIKAAGVKFIKTGEKFPKDSPRQSELSLEDALSGKNYVWTGESAGKGVAFLDLHTDIIPDRVVLALHGSEASRCLLALRFGAEAPVVEVSNSEGDFVLKQNLVMFHFGDETWLSISFTQFRFLALLLEYF